MKFYWMNLSKVLRASFSTVGHLRVWLHGRHSTVIARVNTSTGVNKGISCLKLPCIYCKVWGNADQTRWSSQLLVCPPLHLSRDHLPQNCNQTPTSASKALDPEISALTRHSLLHGWDEKGLSLPALPFHSLPGCQNIFSADNLF